MSSQSKEGKGTASADQVVELDNALWRRLLTGQDEEAFFESWLALQARQLPNAMNAVLLSLREDGRLRPTAFWPKGAPPGISAIKAAQSAVKRKIGVVRKSGRGDRGSSFAYPVMMDDEVVAVGAFTVAEGTDVDLQRALRRVQWGSAWIDQYYAAQRRDVVSETAGRLTTALDVAAISLEHNHAASAGLAVMTELATRLGATRASLGRRRLGGSRLVAVSHSPQISHRQNLSRAITAAMDEAVDQDRVLVWPSTEEQAAVLAKHRELSRQHGAGGPVATVPLHGDRSTIGAVCVEFDPDQEIAPADLDMIEFAGTFAARVLDLRRREERWIITKLIAALWNQLGRMLGRGYLGRKIMALSLIAATAFFYVYRVDFRIPARASLEGAVQRVVSAPYDGYIAQDFARPGDVVAQGDLIARLDDRELQLELAAWQSRRAQYEAERRSAMAERDIARVQVFQAQIEEADVQIGLTKGKLALSEIRAPFSGQILSGDLSQALGSGVRLGDPLYQIAPLDSYRVVLNVDGEDTSRVNIGQKGELLLTSRPDRSLTFEVSKLTAVTVPQDGRNYFRVEAILGHAANNLRPGMQGTARISVGEERLIWIWTRRALNWARITLWKWQP